MGSPASEPVPIPRFLSLPLVLLSETLLFLTGVIEPQPPLFSFSSRRSGHLSVGTEDHLQQEALVCVLLAALYVIEYIFTYIMSFL